MFNLLSKIPVKSHKAISDGLLSVSLLTGIFGLLMVMTFSDSTEEKCTGYLAWKDCVDIAVPTSERLTYLVVGVGLFAVALVSAIAALRLRTLPGRFNTYFAILTGVESMTVQQIADITRSRPARVRDEIQSMISSEMITDFYIDYSADQVVSKKYIPKRSYKTVVKCSECGGNNEVVVGITKNCSFCGQPLLLRST